MQHDLNQRECATQKNPQISCVNMNNHSKLRKVHGLPYHSPLRMQGLGGSGKTRQRLLHREE